MSIGLDWIGNPDTDLANKTMDYFKRLRKEHKMQVSKFQKNFQVNDKTQVASYLVAELVAKQMKAHPIAESLILSSTDKLRSLQKKLGIWKRCALDGNLDVSSGF